MSDILKNPTAMLAKALAPKSIAEGYAAFMKLHRHKLAGGALPAQERGKGTAVEALLEETAGCVRVFKQGGIYYAPRLAARLIHAMGDVLGEETRAWRSDSPTGTEGTAE